MPPPPDRRGPCQSETGWRDIQWQRAIPLTCPQARTHTRFLGASKLVPLSHPSAKGAAIKNHENKQCGGKPCCPPRRKTAVSPWVGVMRITSPEAYEAAPRCSTTLSPAEDGKLSWAGPHSSTWVWSYPSTSRRPHLTKDEAPRGGGASNRVPFSLSGGKGGTQSLGSEDDYKGLQVACSSLQCLLVSLA